MVDTVTPSLDDQEEVVFVTNDASISISLTSPRTDTQDKDPPLTPQDEVPPPTPEPLPPSPPSSPPATINANIISEQLIVSSTCLDTLSVVTMIMIMVLVWVWVIWKKW